MRIEVEILNELGLHARPAAEFVRAAQKYACKIVIYKEGEAFSATSILEILSANLDCGSRMILHAEGPDAKDALDQLAALLGQFKDQEEE